MKMNRVDFLIKRLENLTTPTKYWWKYFNELSCFATKGNIKAINWFEKGAEK